MALDIMDDETEEDLWWREMKSKVYIINSSHLIVCLSCVGGMEGETALSRLRDTRSPGENWTSGGPGCKLI
jgi:hypothetical protein